MLKKDLLNKIAPLGDEDEVVFAIFDHDKDGYYFDELEPSAQSRNDPPSVFAFVRGMPSLRKQTTAQLERKTARYENKETVDTVVLFWYGGLWRIEETVTKNDPANSRLLFHRSKDDTNQRTAFLTFMSWSRDARNRTGWEAKKS